MKDESSHRWRHTRCWFRAVSRMPAIHQIRIIVKSSAYDSSPISIALIICRSFVTFLWLPSLLALAMVCLFQFPAVDPLSLVSIQWFFRWVFVLTSRLIAHFSESKNFWKYFLTISLKIFKIEKIENQSLKQKLMDEKHLICSAIQKYWVRGRWERHQMMATISEQIIW